MTSQTKRSADFIALLEWLDRIHGPKPGAACKPVTIVLTARKVVFCGTFETKGLEVDVSADGALTIIRGGDVPKLVQKVEHITFSGAQARANGQEVIYVTERAVFRLGADAVELVEVTSGVDREREVLARMAFRPSVRLNCAA